MTGRHRPARGWLSASVGGNGWGARLLRPYLARLWSHYDRMSDPAVNPSGRRAANNCSYIAIGLLYAAKPRRHSEAGVEAPPSRRTAAS